MEAWKGFQRGMVLCLVVSVMGCATTEDVRILDGEIFQLQKQMAKSQQGMDSYKNEMTTLKDAYKNELIGVQKEVQRDLAASQNATKKLQADLSLRLENLQSELRTLSTGVDEYKDFVKKPSKEIDRVRQDTASRTKALEEKSRSFEERSRTQEEKARILEERLRGLEDRLKSFEDRLKGLDGKIEGVALKQSEIERVILAKEPSLELKTAPTRVEDLYKEAFETFQRGDSELARRKFESFLKQYPNTGLSDNAQFWIGETYYLKKDYEKAILEYEKAITKYPEGDKVPSAMFKQALAFLEIGDKTSGRNILKRVIERYPYSEQADTARRKLEGIR